MKTGGPSKRHHVHAPSTSPVTRGEVKAVVVEKPSVTVAASGASNATVFDRGPQPAKAVVSSRGDHTGHAHPPVKTQGPLMLRHAAQQEADVAAAWGVNRSALLPQPLVGVAEGQSRTQARAGVAGDIGLPNTAQLKDGRYDIPRLPLLPMEERAVENAFIRMYEANPAGMVADFRARFVTSGQQIFETDGAKQLFPDWKTDAELKTLPPDEKAAAKKFRGTYNSALHQVAHAVVKQAFLQRLDEIAKDPAAQVMVTCGGCVAGKGSLHKIADQDPKLKNVVERIAQHGATFDAAGEQYATDNAWVLGECRKRNIPVTFVYVHNDPELRVNDQFVRAQMSGRLVPAKQFVGSYVEGARNMKDFVNSDAYRQAKEDGLASVVVIDNSKTTYQDGVETNRAVKLAALPDVALDEQRALKAYVAQATLMYGEGKVPREVYTEAVRDIVRQGPPGAGGVA